MAWSDYVIETKSNDSTSICTILGELKADVVSSQEFDDLTYEKIFEKMSEMFRKTPVTQHRCHNCGGTVEMNIDKHIFICPYCGSAYAIGTTHVNDNGSLV